MPPIPVIEYLAVILAGFAAWLLGRLRPDLISPFGDLIARIMHNRNTRIAVIVVWWWLGWHFFTV
ncbi:MAG: hypothetical protein RI987_788 [Actinomycetota bacterium]|jgi:Family of unknown function (DUF6186)